MISERWMIVYFLSGKHFPRSREHEILLPLRIIGVWKNIIKNLCGWMCKSRDSFFIQMLPLELAVLAIIPWLCLILCCIHLQLNQSNKCVISLHALNSCWKVLRKSVQYHIHCNCSFVASEELLTSTGNGQSRSAEQACWRSRHRKCFKWPRQLHRNGMIIFI